MITQSIRVFPKGGKVKIETPQRSRFFSRELIGAPWLIPGSTLTAKIYPSCVEIEGHQICLDGLAREAALFSDLGCGRLELHRKFQGGCERLLIEAKEGVVTCGDFSLKTQTKALPKEQLFLGSSRKLECGKMGLCELIPLVMRLGLFLPEGEAAGSGGPFDLLNEMKEHVSQKAHDKVAPLLEQVLLGYFSKELYPHADDWSRRGLDSAVSGDGQAFLRALALFLRALFLDGLSPLPALLPQFHAGSFVGEEISFRWTKKRLFSALISPKTERSQALIIPHFKKARLFVDGGRGRPVRLDAEHLFKPGSHYFFDRFE